MDRNTVIGLLLIFGLFLGFSFYQSNKARKVMQEQEQQALEEMARQEEDSIAQALSLTAQDSLNDNAAAPAPVSQQQFSTPQLASMDDYVVETNKAWYYFAKQGGCLRKVCLKDVYRYTPKDSAKILMEVFEGGTNDLNINLQLRDQTEIGTRDCLFLSEMDGDTLVVDEAHNTLSLRIYPNNQGDSNQCQTLNVNSYIEYLYTFSPDDYMFSYKVRFVNMEPYLYPNKHNYTLEWNAEPKNVEKNYDNEKNLTSVYYMDNTDEVGNIDERKGGSKDFTSPLKWISFKQQFFTATLIVDGDQAFDSGTLSATSPDKEEREVLKYCKAELDFQMPDLNKGSFNMSMYVGPNQYRLLKGYKMKLERQVPLGWGFFLLHWINRFIIIPVFNWLEVYGLSYGIIILLLTIALKVVLLPVSYKTYMSSAKMRALKPEIEAINARYPKDEDAMKKQQATMALYRSAGVKPAGGCLPMLLQMPILIAMYRFFPASYELRQQSFLWAEDLSAYDSIWNFSHHVPLLGDHLSLFTILMTIATIFYTWINNKLMNPTQGNRDQQRMMNIMMYMMPIMFFFMFNNFASALTYYYLLFNILTFLQMWIFRKAIDENKLHEQLKANMKKPVKKSKWELKMEELQRQQAQMQRQQQKKSK
ncbi:MAG: membrane protein insertase YidC [Bacteroidales bacterium]|nr:membrane protein insertase YidC [Bacteroidales bacterium]